MSYIYLVSGVVPVVFADELPKCPDCGEPYCPKHDTHYADCQCLGPHNAEDEGYHLEEIAGRLMAYPVYRREI